jgi:large subunit ribosomal protein L15
LRVEVAVVNVGRIQQWIDAGRLKGESPLSVNADILAAAGLLKTRGKPLKVLGTGEISAKILFAANAFTDSAVAKIKAAGGDITVYEIATPASAAPVGVKAGKNAPTPGKKAPAKRAPKAAESDGADA